MIRFSKIMGNNQKVGLKKKSNKGEVSLRKMGTLSRDKAIKKDTIKEARVYYQDLLTLANEVQSWVNNDEPIDISLIISLLKSIIEDGVVESLYYYLALKGDKENDVVAHSIDVTVFSLKIGIGMGYDDKRLLALAMIAFLHDVGMYKIPQNILNKQGKLSEQEFKEIQRHPEISADILSRLDSKYKWLADVVLQVHEKADGSGYPRGLRGRDIHEYAAIIGVTDMYSAMVKDRPYRDRFEKSSAVKSIIPSSKGRFPYKVIKAFLNTISLFPISSYVKLNDHSVGRVISTNASFPLKPGIEILYDNRGRALEESKIVDLSEQPLLYIIENVDENDIV